MQRKLHLAHYGSNRKRADSGVFSEVPLGEAMALDDEIIVMNNAVIEQAGSPRDVFNTPRTEFVARFLSGHNVIRKPDGVAALRSDKLRLTLAGTGQVEGSVSGIEYQGAQVSVSVTTGADELTALDRPGFSGGAGVGLCGLRLCGSVIA